MTLQSEVEGDRHLLARRDEREFRYVYAVIFFVSLIYAALHRLSPWRSPAPLEKRISIIQEARTRACRIAPYFFMG